VADKPARIPPLALVRTINRLRNGMQRLTQSVVPGNVALLELGTGHWVTQMLYVAAKLGIADELAAGPQHAVDVARRIGADPDATYRLMRALASKGVLRQRLDNSFVLTKVGRALQSDAEGSLRDMVLFAAHPVRWADWGNLLHAVSTGQTATEKLHGKPFFELLHTDDELAGVFNNAMTAMSRLSDDAALAGYDFSGSRLIVDVGGGHGNLLATILRGAPDARGVLYDLASVVEDAPAALRAAGVDSRCSVQAGSFFDSVPDGGDAYVLKNIVHDWNDEDALRILRNVRTAIVDHGRMLLLEMVLPQHSSPHFSVMLDLEMLVTVGGRERTRAEYANLLRRAGFRLNRVVETVCPVSIIEAVPA
jgi:hypothetical protein